MSNLLTSSTKLSNKKFKISVLWGPFEPLKMVVDYTWARGGGTVLPLIRRIGGKINGPIHIWEAAQTEFIVKIRIRIHKSRTNSYFDFFACRRFFLVDSNLWDQFVFWDSVLPCLLMYGVEDCLF